MGWKSDNHPGEYSKQSSNKQSIPIVENDQIFDEEALPPPPEAIPQAKSKLGQRLEDNQSIKSIDQKLSHVIEMIGNKVSKEDLDSLINVGNELVDISNAAKKGEIDIDNYEGEDWFAEHELEMVGNEAFLDEGENPSKVLNIPILKPLEQGVLGLRTKEPIKTSPDCGEHKGKGRIPNKEKLKWDGEASGQLKIETLLKVGKGDPLPEQQ